MGNAIKKGLEKRQRHCHKNVHVLCHYDYLCWRVLDLEENLTLRLPVVKIFSSELCFFLIVGHYHFVGAYAGATACLRGHSGSLRGHKL